VGPKVSFIVRNYSAILASGLLAERHTLTWLFPKSSARRFARAPQRLCGATSSLAVPTPEFFDAPGGIDDLLLAGIKRMARGADIEVEIIVG